jgi:hypothetical protein
MFDVADSLQSGLEAARSGLNAAQSLVARANAGSGGRGADAAMAAAARAALFEEALLSAVHARLAEIKAVAK